MRPIRITSSQLAFLIVTISLWFFAREAEAQLSSSENFRRKDTFAILNNRLKIVLKDKVFEEIPNDSLTKKYSHSFGLGQLVNAYGLAHGGDTLVFFQTSIDRPVVNDGGVSIWKMIGSFADKVPASHWVESGWNAAGRDFIYFVKLISNEEAKQYFEFNFFFIDNKLAFSLHQRPLIQKYFTDQKKYGILFAK